LARATLNDLLGGSTQGGSTITQQYVKNVYTGSQQTIRRKIVEAHLAYQLEQRHSKDWILTAYLNTVFFGHNAYGVETAAQIYFGLHARTLTLPDAALLAGLVRGPSDYDPVTHPVEAKDRRNLVLDKMYEQGMISKRDWLLARTAPLLPHGHKLRL